MGTKAARRLKGKEMTLDSTFDFEKKRNTPVRYDRDLWVKTVKAIDTVKRIRHTRKLRFQKQRLKDQRKLRINLAQKELNKESNKLLMAQKTKAQNKAAVKKVLVAREMAKAQKVKHSDAAMA